MAKEIAENVLNAWIAAAEIPFEWLIPLLYEAKSTENIYNRLVIRRESMDELIPEASIRILRSTASDEALAFFEKTMTDHGIHSMTILEKGYPHCLREIGDPPGIIFYQGNPECLNLSRKTAVIGSRSASYAGLKATRKIAAELSRNKVAIISGLAYGIDTEAHRGCLDGGSPTIAVTGCGLDQDYPQGNAKLKEEILANGGLILTEYAPGSKPVGRHFPYRNRIISGLSDAVILMEAKIRSGSMTTIGHALKQGREVFVYPGDPVSLLSEANRMLLREGARYFTEASDILSDMNWLDNRTHVGQNIGCSAPFHPSNAAEGAVYNALRRGTLGFDELLAITSLSSSELMGTITVLQIRKVIEALPGKQYQII